MTGSVSFISLGPWLRSTSRSVYRSPRSGAFACIRARRLEAPPGFEPGMEVLQTSALPLGDGADRTGSPWTWENRIVPNAPHAIKDALWPAVVRHRILWYDHDFYRRAGITQW